MADPQPEPREIRLKRLYMRSIRRGIKEMDIILTRYADEHLANLSPQMLDCYEAMLSENDQDLYAWISGQAAPPEPLSELISDIKTIAYGG